MQDHDKLTTSGTSSPEIPEHEPLQLTSDLESPKKTQKYSVVDGVAIALSFIAVAIAINAIPDYLPGGVARVLAIVVGTLGVVGLGFSLEELADGKFKLGFADMGMGVLFFVAWGVTYFFFDLWIVNFLTIILLFGTAFGIIGGILRLFVFLMSASISASAKAGRAFIVISQLAAFVYVVIEILIALKVYK